MRVPWTARKSNQSILKEFSPEHSLEGLLLKLKLQYLDHLMRKANSLGKILMLGKSKGKRRRGQQRMRWLDSITERNGIESENSQRWWRTEEPGMLQSMTYQLNNNMLTGEGLSLHGEEGDCWEVSTHGPVTTGCLPENKTLGKNFCSLR